MGGRALDVFLDLVASEKKLTLEENNVLDKCSGKALMSFVRGSLFVGAVVWTATPKLGKLVQVFSSVGAGLLAGRHFIERSINSSLENILALDGTPMQKELATIIMNKYQNFNPLMQLVQRHFYAEKTFDDSNTDLPTVRWRYRNFYSDNVASGDNTDGNDSQTATHPNSRNDSDVKSAVSSKQVPITNSSNLMDDPFEKIFGYSTAEEIQHPSSSTTPTQIPTHNHRRSHRRRHLHRHEASLHMTHAQSQ